MTKRIIIAAVLLLGVLGVLSAQQANYPSGGAPGGSNTQLQYNNNGLFAGTSGFTWTGTAPAFLGSAPFTITTSGGNQIFKVVNGGSTHTIFSVDANTDNNVALNDQIGAQGITSVNFFATANNCAVNSASPAACGTASSGAVVVPTTTTTYTINTSAVTAASRIILMPMSFAGNLPSAPTCVSPAVTSAVSISAITAATSFTFALPSTTGQTCWEYWIVD